MKIYQFIKVSFIIFVLSSNLMLGQKNDASIIEKRCFGKQEIPADLQIFPPTPDFAQTIIENCREVPPMDSLETGAFFRFAAF